MKLRKRCMSCDSVLDDDGNCFFCNPKPLSAVRPIRVARKPADLVATAILVAVLIALLWVLARVVGTTFWDLVLRPVRWILDFQLGAPVTPSEGGQ